MLWCLISIALICGMLGLAVLMVQPPRIHLPQMRLPRVSPHKVLRGCIALPFLLLAVGLTVIALLFMT